MSFSKPNLQLPLAVSYNNRGISQNNVFTTGLDQRKINCIYEPVANAVSGGTTLYLAKRPGVTVYNGTYGSASQTAYLAAWVPDPDSRSSFDGTQACVFSELSDDQRCSNDTGTVVIENIANYAPAHWRITAISNVPTMVLQLQSITVGGVSAQRVWYSNDIQASNGGTWARITDADFPGSAAIGAMEHMDGFAFIAAQGTGFIHNSDINSLANWQAQNKIRKQIVEDEVLGLAKIGKRLVCLGYETMEVFGNAGNPTGSPLVTIPDLFAKVGLARAPLSTQSNGDYYCVLGDSMYWVGRPLGRRHTSGSGLYRFNGNGKPVKVSSQAMDKLLSGDTICSVNAVNLFGKQAVALMRTTIGSSTPKWLIYFPEWNDWFEWESTVFSPINNGNFFLGVDDSKLYVFGGSDTWQDNTTDYTMTVQFMLPKDGNHRKRMPMCGVAGDTARSASSLNVEFSDDDYQNFSTARAIDMTSQQKMLARCGSFRTRAVRLTHTGNLDCRIEKFLARIE